VIVPGYTYHLTHRCHDREFPLRFQRDRTTYRRWLREGALRHGVPVLGYCITSNHVHVVTCAEAREPVSAIMRPAAGCTAAQYNQRKSRRGGFWEGRFRCTAVENGEHLLSCLAYVDMNMVRAGVLEHPADWNWCGYREVGGLRGRYRIVDRECLVEKLQARDFEEIREAYCGLIDERAEGQRLAREPRWSEPVAVGSEGLVREVAGKLGRRRQIEVSPVEQADQQTWHAREVAPRYNHFSGGENRF
jgi:putative transposase